eukprot:UN19388
MFNFNLWVVLSRTMKLVVSVMCSPPHGSALTFIVTSYSF